MMKQNPWWRGAVIYQIYPRSFSDSNADGVGDLHGIISKLDYVASLGVDAVWISPFFKSPMKDFGYDVSDYREVDPIFGSIDDFRQLLTHAHNVGLKVLIDQVWSHTSDQHGWFRESRMAQDMPKSDWYVWADPKPDGTPPNNWLSYFGGPAWTWDSRRQQYYLHHFLKEQPTLNLWNPDVRSAIKNVAGYWLDMGVDGFRLDVAHAYLSDRHLRDNPVRNREDTAPSDVPASNPMSWQKRVHSMCVPENLDWIEELSAHINRWPDRCLLAEAGGDHSEKIAASYVQTGKRFHLAYSFGLVGSSMTKQDISSSVRIVEEVLDDGWLCWSTGNHDFKRVVSRINPFYPNKGDIARYAMALGLSLRGSFCMYQGEELGLTQAELPFEDLVDPYDIMLYPEHVGRDGCRTPMPWIKNAPHAGFSSSPRKTWLPVYFNHLENAVDQQERDEHSILNTYRTFLRWRKNEPALCCGAIELLDAPDPIFAHLRSDENGPDRILCVFNTADQPTEWKIPATYKDYVLIDDAHHNIEVKGSQIELAPYGYALFAN